MTTTTDDADQVEQQTTEAAPAAASPSEWKFPPLDSLLAAHDEVTSIHTACEAVPEMDPESFGELVNAIAKDGLLDPIRIDKDGRLLDGRNRLAACHVLGIEPHFETTPADPWAIATCNVARRHLTTGQRAAFAAARLGDERASAAQRKATSRKQSGSDECQNSDAPKGRATELAGKAVGVSRDSVSKYEKLPKPLKKEVKAGKKSLNAAHKEAGATAGNKKPRAGKRKRPAGKPKLPDGIEVSYDRDKVTVLRHAKTKMQAVIRGPVGGKFLFHLDHQKQGTIFKDRTNALRKGADHLLESVREGKDQQEPSAGSTDR